MTKTVFALALAAVAGIGTAQAQNYQMEGEVGYIDFESDSALDASFTYHFAPVATAGHPLAEAAFLTNSSNMSIKYLTFDDADSDTIGVDGEFYFGQIYLRGAYSSSDNAGTDSDTIGARIGYVLSPGLRIAAGIDRVDDDGAGDASNDIVVEAKYVTKLAGETAFNAEASLTLFDQADEELIEVSGDYYFNRALSVGAVLSFADDNTNYGVNARYFFTPVISGQLEYRTVNDGDDDVFRISAALRF